MLGSPFVKKKKNSDKLNPFKYNMVVIFNKKAFKLKNHPRGNFIAANKNATHEHLGAVTKLRQVLVRVSVLHICDA